MRRSPAPHDYDGWVGQVGISSCRQRARMHLVASGRDAVPALRRGLRHPKTIVRQQCVRIFDQLVDDEALPEVVLALDDPDVGVRKRALHTLACDRCKKNECSPGEELWVPRALEFLHDADPDLRAGAIDALGNVVARRPDVAAALRVVADNDRDKGLRGMARRFVGP
jgi:HEAT repeat protein